MHETKHLKSGQEITLVHTYKCPTFKENNN